MASSPEIWEGVFRHAVAFYDHGLRDEAGALFAAIAEHHPGHLATLQRLAAIRRQQGRLEESRALLVRAVEANGESAEAWNSLGNTLNELGRGEEAVEAYHRATTLRSDFAEAWFNLGNSLRALTRWDEAAQAYGEAIARRPDYADAHNNLGLTYDQLRRPAEALACFQRAVEIDPSIAMGYNNVALALTDLDRHEEALEYFARARAIDPEAAEPVFNEALVRLAIDYTERGWRDYEARWRLPRYRPNANTFQQPQWDGRASPANKTILLHAEQGLGDTILFARFIPMVAQRGARVILAAQDALLPLLANLEGVSQFIGSNDPLPPFDLHAPVGSLPGAFGTTLDTIPASVPYLTLPLESRTIAASESAGRRNVGVCWAGNPKHLNDRNRSIRLSDFARIFSVSGVRFECLQQKLKAGDEETLARCGVNVAPDCGTRSLADTAALISRLDLVITVDTAIAHLAGALGKPVWVLIPFRPYWVWLRHRADSPWYPTARIFRQSAPADWPGVMEEVAAALNGREFRRSGSQAGDDGAGGRLRKA